MPSEAGRSTNESPLTVLVMDPLSKRLACACVQGYAQRDYSALGEHIERYLGQPVRIVEAESFLKGLMQVEASSIQLIIGKDSVVHSLAPHEGFEPRRLTHLTGLDGKTTLSGLFVVRREDKVRKLSELEGRDFFFGPEAEKEKHGAALEALGRARVRPREPLQTRAGCNEAILDLVESTNSPPPVAVISSYALPLVSACGITGKGSLRILGETPPLPFITVFGSQHLGADQERRVVEALLAVRKNKALCRVLESKAGFVAAQRSPGDSEGRVSEGWPQWLGPTRDGRAAWLPEALPNPGRVLWRQEMESSGVGGLVASENRVVVSGRDSEDTQDVFRCLDARTGRELWRLAYAAEGKLDYGSSPRATPLIHNGRVFVLGAFGHLHCVKLETGAVLWKKDLCREYEAGFPKWGYSASPIVVDEKLILAPGGSKASLVALNVSSGRMVWRTPGRPAAYASFIAPTVAGRKQLIGYDAETLGGWNADTGKRLWEIKPETEGDFNVPTPQMVEGRLFVATENNGARLYEFNSAGIPNPKPAAVNELLRPDMATPIACSSNILGVCGGLLCLDPHKGLEHTLIDDPKFSGFGSILTFGDRALIVTQDGELVLVRNTEGRLEILTRQFPFGESCEVYSTPALLGTRLFLRNHQELLCMDLAPAAR